MSSLVEEPQCLTSGTCITHGLLREILPLGNLSNTRHIGRYARAPLSFPPMPRIMSLCRPIRRKDKRWSKTAPTTEQQDCVINPASQERRLGFSITWKENVCSDKACALMDLSGESVVI